MFFWYRSWNWHSFRFLITTNLCNIIYNIVAESDDPYQHYFTDHPSLQVCLNTKCYFYLLVDSPLWGRDPMPGLVPRTKVPEQVWKNNPPSRTSEGKGFYSIQPILENQFYFEHWWNAVEYYFHLLECQWTLPKGKRSVGWQIYWIYYKSKGSTLCLLTQTELLRASCQTDRRSGQKDKGSGQIEKAQEEFLRK
jgi:hypothetical protein